MFIIHLSVIHKNTVFQPKSPELPCGRVAVPILRRGGLLAVDWANKKRWRRLLLNPDGRREEAQCRRQPK